MSAETIPATRARPLAIAERYAIVAAAAVLLAALHLHHRPATLCLFRAITGLPCPLCGGTTAAVNLGRGDLAGALRASPLVVGGLALGPALCVTGPPRWWRSPRLRHATIATLLIAAEVWQLARFGIIHVSSIH